MSKKNNTANLFWTYADPKTDWEFTKEDEQRLLDPQLFKQNEQTNKQQTINN